MIKLPLSNEVFVVYAKRWYLSPPQQVILSIRQIILKHIGTLQ